VFISPSQVMAKEIPNNKHVIILGVGHMTAIEAREKTVDEILKFLEEIKTKTKDQNTTITSAIK